MQDPVLFSVSLGANIAYGLPDEDVSKDDIIKAAKAANAHGFIISLPQVSSFQIHVFWNLQHHFLPSLYVLQNYLFNLGL